MNTTILENSYCGYRTFIDSILTPIFGSWNIFAQPENQIDGSFSATVTACIQSVYKVADIRPLDSSPIELYDVTVKDSVNIANARVGIRELIKRLEFPYTHAFILFHYANPKDRSWRFSYLFKEGTQTQTTNAKRYTYVFGPSCPCRTAKQRFDTLANAPSKSDDKIKEAFSVEALSREFFDEYKEHYADFVQYVTGKRIVEVSAKKFETKEICEPNEDFYNAFGRDDKRVRDYVKKMMGRLIFLCFIQRKGWLNKDPYYLQNLFANSSEKGDFLDAVLEPMFFGLLNTKPQDRKKYFNEHDWDISLIPGADNIPYLNGGLFEADENDAPPSKFPLELFSNTTSTTIQDTPKKYRRYEKNNAADIYDYHRFRGLFDFFAAYNFTIDENDPNDAEIGVDPEMLGKIFENLLEDNKDKGAYYTPKEIVQYMCRESLIAYLTSKAVENNNGKFPYEQVEQSVRKLILSPEEIAPKMNDRQKADFGKAIREVKICDPAIGSGAFPMGLLNELVRCRVSIGAWALDANNKPLVEDYASLKREIVCNNIYGVDIEKGAIDIARLRFWLSIVVDMKEPAALPNFDYKFMQGNSLITTFAGEYINLSSDQQHTNITKMREEKHKLYNLKKAYYTASGEEKHRLSVEIKNSIIQLISLQLGYEARSWADSHAEQLSMFPEPKQLSIQEIVAQLPPEKLRVIETGKNIRSILNNEAISLEERAKTDIQFFDWRMMFTEVFEGDNSGFDIVIGNPPYIKEYENKDAFNAVRLTPYYKAKMDIWFCFTCVGLDLLKRNGILSYIAQPQWRSSDAASIMRNKICEDAKILQIIDFGSFMVFDASTQAMIFVLQKEHNETYQFAFKINQGDCLKKAELINFLNERNIIIPFEYQQYINKSFTFALNKKENDIIEQIESKRNFEFDGKNEIIQGIIGGPDDAFKITESKKSGFSNIEKSFVKPFYTSTERFVAPEAKEHIIYIHDKNVEDFNRTKYPNIYAQLDTYREKLEQRREVLLGRKSWFSLWWERDESFFVSGEKIIFAARTYGRSFTYTVDPFYASRNCFIVKSSRISLKYVVGLLNSKLLDFYMHNKLKMNGDLLQIDKVQFLSIPIHNASNAEKAQLEHYVDEVLFRKKSNPNANTSDLEKRIDDLVYELYGLSGDEKEIVRNA